MPTFNYVSTTTQDWTVPSTGPYSIQAKGARGGSAYLLSTSSVNTGGNGANIKAEFNLTAGHVIRMMVASPGVDCTRNDRGGGGGGMTVVYNQTTSTLLLVAGGGGGAGQYTGASLKDASLTTTGRAGSLASSSGAGGAGPAAGGNGTFGHGGAGYSGAPAAIGYSTPPSAYPTGAGGLGYDGGTAGGYGGGGGAYAGAGGGGGYGGGGGGGWSYSGDGGGGGSYITGTNQVTSVDNYGSGQVVITLLNAAPVATITAPTVSQVITDPWNAKVFSWTYSDADGNAQTQYEVGYKKLTDAGWTTTTGTTATSHNYPAYTFDDGSYLFRVRVKDSLDWSAYTERAFSVSSWTTLTEVTSASTSGIIDATAFTTGDYEFRVRTSDAQGYSSWSTIKASTLLPGTNTKVRVSGSWVSAIKKVKVGGIWVTVGTTKTKSGGVFS